MYSQNDLTVINKAISDLQAGRRVTSVSYGDTHVQYANMSLEELLKMRSLILANLENSNSSCPAPLKLVQNEVRKERYKIRVAINNE